MSSIEVNAINVYMILIFNGLLTGLGVFFGQIIGKKVYNKIKNKKK